MICTFLMLWLSLWSRLHTQELMPLAQACPDPAAVPALLWADGRAAEAVQTLCMAHAPLSGPGVPGPAALLRDPGLLHFVLSEGVRQLAGRCAACSWRIAIPLRDQAMLRLLLYWCRILPNSKLSLQCIAKPAAQHGDSPLFACVLQACEAWGGVRRCRLGAAKRTCIRALRSALPGAACAASVAPASSPKPAAACSATTN